MLKPMRIIIVSLSLLLANMAHAAPPDTPDDLGILLASKGLLNQIDQVRQSVTDKASDLVVNALGFLGVPYKRGGNSVVTGLTAAALSKPCTSKLWG